MFFQLFFGLSLGLMCAYFIDKEQDVDLI